MTATFPEIDTPALLFDLDVVEANVREMADVARAASVAVRPHAKTHKSPEIAALYYTKKRDAYFDLGGTSHCSCSS